jgi:hypothetical protein
MVGREAGWMKKESVIDLHRTEFPAKMNSGFWPTPDNHHFNNVVLWVIQNKRDNKYDKFQ